jgi:hypothetical protein
MGIQDRSVILNISITKVLKVLTSGVYTIQPKKPILEVAADESINPSDLSYSGRSNISITLQGMGSERTVSLNSNGSLFTVGSGVTLTLDSNITLRGRSGNNNSLVYVWGTLVMNTGSKITENTSGGVMVNGTFTMNGGTSTGNTTSNLSGGVYVVQGTFTMNGGTSTGNTATSGGGGGVMVGGTFTMSGGTISGNTGNGYNTSGGVRVQGYFTKTGGTIYGYTAGNSNSNKVQISGTIMSGYGHGVYGWSSTTTKYKDSTAGTGVNLMFDGRNSPATFSGAWDN